MSSVEIRCLLVEDDEDIRELIEDQLLSLGLQVDSFEDGERALLAIQERPQYHLYILDWLLPGKSGLEICAYLRANLGRPSPPIIMVTALATKESLVKGLDAGADDYITKPFDLSELKARLRVQLRRIRPTENSPLVIVEDRYEILLNNQKLDLTSTEFRLLQALCKESGKVFTRNQLTQLIQGPGIFVGPRTIDTHMVAIRKKISAMNGGDLIETVRSVGYRLSTDSLLH